MPPAPYVSPISLLLVLGRDMVIPTSVAGLRSPSPVPQQQQAAKELLERITAEDNMKWTLDAPEDSYVHHRRSSSSGDVSECILLFGAFCNGNLGDVIQPTAMEHLLSAVAPDQCFWYAHPWVENHDQGNHIGEFFSDSISGDTSRLIHLTPDHAEEVNRFKALVIGGGGIFAANHSPLDVGTFAEGLTLPIIVMGVGASSYRASKYTTLLERAVFVSGRDMPSVDAFSNLLQKSEDRATQPNDVALVRDPVLSDKMLTDTTGTCWKQSEGEHEQPLCFILPASNTQASVEMHRHLLTRVVRLGDVFVNVFPKHQQEILSQHDYPGEIVKILDPREFAERLCSCRAIISTRFHGVILGLHMGVPTFGASGVSHGNKVPEVLIDTMRLPEQYFVINDKLTREVVDQEVGVVREMYANHDRRLSIQARLSVLHDDFMSVAHHVLFDIVGVQKQQLKQQQQQQQQQHLHQQEHHRGGVFFSSAEIAAFLPVDSEQGWLDASERDSISGAPSVDGSKTVTTVVTGEAAVDKASDSAVSDMDITKKERKVGRLTTEKAEEEAEKIRAAVSMSPESAPGTGWGIGNTPGHSIREPKSGALRLSKPPTTATTAVVHRPSAVKINGAATTTTASENAAPRLKDFFGSTDVPAKEEAGKSLPLADALLASREFVDEFKGEAANSIDDAYPHQPQPKASLVETSDGSKLSTEKADPSTAEALLSIGGVFKKGEVAKAQPEKRDGQNGEATSAVGYRRSIPESPERVTTFSNHIPSVLGMASAADKNVNVAMPAVGERASTNDAIASVLIHDEFLAGTFLLVVVVGLALLPSGGSPRKASYDNLVGKDGFPGSEGGEETATIAPSDEDSRASSDSETGVPPRKPSATLLARSGGATAGIAAKSSKMLSMFNFAMWVSLAMGFSGYGKVYLTETRDPVGLLILQGFTGVVGLGLLGRFGALDLYPGKDMTPTAIRQAGLAAVLHTGQALLTNFAVLLGGVSATNALKAMEPVAAAAFSYFLLGKTCSGARMAALATMVVGLFLLTFRGNHGGGSGDDHVLVSAVLAMAAVCCNALRNVVIKRGSPIHPHQTLLACSAAATVVGIGLMLLRLMCRTIDNIQEGRGSGNSARIRHVDGGHDFSSGWLRLDGVNAALCFVGYNLASFNLLVRLSPVGHAVGNSCKRMLVFASGLLFLGEVMSVRQLGGTALALAGVLAYNLAGTR